MKEIQARIKRDPTLDAFCSSSEMVRIWNFHAMNNLISIERTCEFLGIEESKLVRYFEDFLIVNPDPVFHKQFLGMHSIISKDIPNYGGTPILLKEMLRLIFELRLPIPIKALWAETKFFDFHYYCAYEFWPKIWQSIDRSLDQKRNI